jgi:DHA2 family multidrug resistance protein-like MFS transporter
MGATGRVLGQALGAALVAGLFGLDPDGGSAFALYVAAAIAVAAAVVSGLRLPPRPA